LATLVDEITKLLNIYVGKTPRNAILANNLAAYLRQKYLIINRKADELGNLIERHPKDLAEFFESISAKEFQSILKHVDQLPGLKKKKRAKPQTEAERAQRLKRAKNTYERRRRAYRDGLIEEEFGSPQPRVSASVPSALLPLLSPSTGSTGSCLDILFSGGVVKLAGDWDSLENLFGVDRHRFPKSLSRRPRGRNAVYDLEAFVVCLIHLLENQWLPEPTKRKLVLDRIIKRASQYAAEVAGMLEEKLRPYRS
jgi:hypothetical protein